MRKSRSAAWLLDANVLDGGGGERSSEPAATTREVETRRLNRLNLRLLDACLDQLENAHERDESNLSVALAARLRPYVPTVFAGMSITEAIDIVLQRQERYLGHPEAEEELPATPARTARIRDQVDPRLERQLDRVIEPPAREPLDETAARALTESIRSAGRGLCLLMLEAHDRRAWRALGYGTWERYVRREFGISRSRSYELLDQGRVVLAIREAAGTAEVPFVSAYAALQLKPRLAALLDTVRRRTRGLAGHETFHVVSRLVDDFRRGGADPRGEPPGPDPVAHGGTQELSSELRQVVERLSHMPPADEVLRDLDAEQLEWLRSLPDALRWLSDFTSMSSDRLSDERHRPAV
jgi:hypothetical protein